MPVAAACQPVFHPRYAKSERLTAEITELHAYLTAATARFLALVRAFDAGVTRWSGERIDWDLAVSHLFPVNDE